MGTAPPPKKKLPVSTKRQLPPKSVSSEKIVQQADVNKVYELHRDRRNRGSKIIVYGASGMGKTTLATLAPNPVFVAADDGIDEILHPVTGKPIPHYCADTYQDVRGILNQPKLFGGFKTIVLDTMTEVENKSVPFILSTIKNSKGNMVNNLEGYGWGSGFTHLSDHDTYIKNDLTKLADLGFDIVVLCQMAPRREASASTEDYIKDSLKLVYRPGSQAFAATEFVEWADHCFKIDYGDLQVVKKRAITSGSRVIRVHPEPTFDAKSRTIPLGFPVVTFSAPDDDSIWQFVFNEAWKNIEPETADESS
jgi:hypothetical protein